LTEWNPQPLYFEMTPRGVIASSWPDQIEVDKAFLALADRAYVAQTEGGITFSCVNGSQHYRLVGDLGNGTLQYQRDTGGLATQQPTPRLGGES